MCARYGVKRSELEPTPFIEELSGRAVPQGIFYDPNYDPDKLPEHMRGEEWFMIHPTLDGKLEWLFVESIESGYFGRERADQDKDLLIPFLNLYYQHLSWPDILGIMPDLVEDVRNLTTCLSKLAVYQYLSEINTVHIRRFVVTEIEYLFNVARSLYDLLQFVIKNTWDRVRFKDGRETNQLKTGFADMALQGDEPRQANELIEKYGLTESLAGFYEDTAEDFLAIKEYRDAIAHEGDTVDTVFFKDDGIAIRTTAEPYSRFQCWTGDQLDENDLGPIWPFAASIVENPIQSLNEFANALAEKGLGVPPHIAPGYDFYIRGSHIHNLNYLDQLKQDDCWGTEFVEDVRNRIGV